MKLLTPGQLHSICVKEHYDVEIAYLEGPSTRIIAGCNDPDTKLVSWVHVEQLTRKCAAAAYRSYNESVNCYDRFDRIICVSNTVQQDFAALYPQIHITDILYNTVETARKSAEKMSEKYNTHFSYYKCLFCDGYHVGKNKDNKTEYDNKKD
jgi:hypothetical protein